MTARRFAALLTALLLAVSCVGPALAVGGGVHDYKPIYLGGLYADVDYMADQVLAEIPTAGRTDREKLFAVYAWIQEHCSREPVEGVEYFDEEQVRAASSYYADLIKQAVSAGQATIRREFDAPYVPGYYWGSVMYSVDTNELVGNVGRSILYTRCGTCEAFSALFTILVSHLGYDCRMVEGVFFNRDGTISMHKWNCVLIDGQYYWLDVRIDHAEYTRTGKISTTYFLVESTDAWAERHGWYHGYTDWLFTNAGKIAGLLDQEGGVPLSESDQSGQSESSDAVWSRCSAWAEPYLTQADTLDLLPDALQGCDMTAPITRAEFAAAAMKLYKALSHRGVPMPDRNPFRDCQDGEVLRAWSLGVVQGVGEGRFAPDTTLTREQAATMLGRVYELVSEGAVGSGDSLFPQTLDFSDAGSIGSWARSYIGFFAAVGILDGMGDGRFAPQGTMTREQALKVAVVCLEKLG